MTDLERVRQAIECGLLPAIRIVGRPRGQKTLAERLARYKVPGLSVALIVEGETAWTGAYGLLEAGGDAPAATWPTTNSTTPSSTPMAGPTTSPTNRSWSIFWP